MTQNPCSHGNFEWNCASAASFCGACALQVSGLHMAWPLVAFDFVSLDVVVEPVRECDNDCTATVPRFEYSITHLRDDYNIAERR